MTRRLFISGFLPSGRMPSGGQKLAYQELQRQCLVGDSRITVLGFCNSHERRFISLDEFAECESATILHITIADRMWGALRYSHLPLVASGRYAKGRRWLSGKRFDEVWVEFIQAAALLRELEPKTRSTLVVHDLFHEAFARRARGSSGLARQFWRLESRRTERWERAEVRRADRIITLSSREREIIRGWLGGRDVEVRYPEVGSAVARVRRVAGRIRPDTILFFGLMSRAENEDAAEWFVTAVLPRIRARRPQARFIIAGASPGKKTIMLRSENVDVAGFVDDPTQLFSECAIAVAPLRFGSGIKIKVVEYLAAGIPTVSTSVGAEGIEGNGLLLVGDSAERFAELCCSVLER